MASYGRAIRRMCALLGLFGGMAATTLVAAPAEGQNAPDNWATLNLGETTVGGTRVYYERVLEPNLPFIIQEVRKFVEGRDKVAGVLAKRREIIAEINRLLGETEPDLIMQDDVFTMVSGMLSQLDLTFRFVRQETIKQFLRAGGQLPDFAYDPQSDTVTYNARIHVSTQTETPRAWDLCIPLPPDVPLETYLSGGLAAMGNSICAGGPEVVIHEVTEVTLLRRARPSDPYWRWFSDGFANAITHKLIARHMGTRLPGSSLRRTTRTATESSRARPTSAIGCLATTASMSHRFPWRRRIAFKLPAIRMRHSRRRG